MGRISKKKPNIFKNKIFLTSFIFLITSLTFLICSIIILTIGNKQQKEEELINETTNLELISIEKFSSPVKGNYKITSRQGLRNSLTLPDSGGSTTNEIFHNAIDFSVPEKTEIYATKSGTVITCYPGYLNGSKWKGHETYGGCIIILHDDNTLTLYAHLSMTQVNEGKYVERGQLIGLSGGNPKYKTSGKSTGSHLHYAIYLNMNSLLDNEIN